ncbi:hypothetical protein DL93DRAFT_2085770 [Clavulina sp. PMI_390]|nr:hypothetical protein DL93DRAFT_2085770 [Clavulina sp. PMI_390]
MPLPNPSSDDFKPYIERLTDPAFSPENKKVIALELRDWNEFHREQGDLAKHLAVELPIIIKVLRDGEPSFKRESPEHQTRHALLQIIERLPHSEAMKEYVVDIQALMIHLLRTDNEELGVICVRIVINFNRTFRAQLEPHNMAFIEWIVELYDGMASVVERTFSSDLPPSSSPAASMQGTPFAGENEPQNVTLVPSSQSFKVLVECPIATVLFTNEPDQSMSKYSTMLVPASIKLLQLQVEQQKRAHEEYAKTLKMWLGMADDIKNRAAYNDFIAAQTKVMSYIAVVFRHPHEQFRHYAELIPGITVRLLKDCPVEASSTRKDLLIAMRHITHDELRPLFFQKLGELLDERVLMGIGVASHEGLRTFAYSNLADLIHHSRDSLTPELLSRVINAYSCNLHMMSLPYATQILTTRLFVNLPDLVVAKCTAANAAHLLTVILRTCVAKLEVLYRSFEDLVKLNEGSKGPDAAELNGFVQVERAKPVETLTYYVDNPDAVIRDARLVYYTTLVSIKNTLVALTKVEGPTPDAEMMKPFFVHGIRCLVLYEKFHIPVTEKDILEKVVDVFLALRPHVFQELWSMNLTLFMEYSIKHASFLSLPQVLITKDQVSKLLISVILQHLVSDLESLGSQDTKHAAGTLRMFKMCFMAATMMPDHEMTLVNHITKIMTDSFSLAAKAQEPTHYYLLLRALFRAIGGHKYEAMYGVVAPLLEESLKTLNRLLVSAPLGSRDLIAELALTVPVRLTHLLPFLHLLMRPLVYALRAPQELVAQGLRTLELCVDNLTPEFLDPTLAPVLPELMGALYDILRPIPHSHLSAHTTIRILGKLGGRNRRLQDEPPILSHMAGTHEAEVLFSFDGRNEAVDIGPICRLAAKSIRHQNPTYRAQAYEVLKSAMTMLVHKGCDDNQRADVFNVVDAALFQVIHTTEHGAHAFEFVRDLSKHIFTSERNYIKSDLAKRTNFAPIIALHLDILTNSLATIDARELEKTKELVTVIIKDLLAQHEGQESSTLDTLSVVHLMITSFMALCWEDATARKMAGFHGLTIFFSPDISAPWMQERYIDIMKCLVAILKDTPPDTVKGIDEISKLLHQALRCYYDGIPKPAATESGAIQIAQLPTAFQLLIRLLVVELPHPNTLLREAIREGIRIIAELVGQTVVETLTPLREVLVVPIYAKPLRALPLVRQTAHVDTIAYALTLRPPLIPVSEELWRMLNEALAVADTTDENIMPNQRRNSSVQRSEKEAITNLRISCLRFLTSSIHVTEFFSAQPGLRQRVISVYFKSLYWAQKEVKDAATEGLQTALLHQARLPKDLLHTGLMPILTNLSDSKRLTLPNLDGLGRLMDLLTNHFKVEIGVKLLDHHRQLADPKMLTEASHGSLETNEEIQKLARLTDIFHRLPSGASMYLADLSDNVVAIENVLCATIETPFTGPLAAFYEKYPSEAVDYLYDHVDNIRHVRTIRSVIVSKKAPAFNAEVTNQIPRLISACLKDQERTRIISGLSLSLDIATLDPDAFVEQDELIQALINVWLNEFNKEADIGYHQPLVQTDLPTLLIAIFRLCLERKLRVDMLFAIIAIYPHRVGIDLSGLSRFLYGHVVMSAPMETKRAILTKFLTWFDEPSPPRERMSHFLRVIINPMIITTYSPPPSVMEESEGLITADIVDKMHDKIWEVIASYISPTREASDALAIELTHMTSLMLQYCSELIHEYRKIVMRAAWVLASSDDAIVKQTAHLLISRFFKAFDSPPKLILKVWISLLRPQNQNEGRHLVRQAVDTLAPVLPLRIKDEATNSSLAPKIPAWIKVTKRFLTEESGGLNPTIAIYRVITRHPELFFPYREQFVPHMVGSLTKLFTNSLPEMRLVTLEILEHILRWEKQQTQPAEGSSTDHPESAESSDANQWSVPNHLKEICVNTLVRTAFLPDQQTRNLMLPKALRLIRDFLAIPSWSETGVKPHIFDRMLVSAPGTEEQSPHAATALRLLLVSIEDKPESWILDQLSNLKNWLEKPFSSNDATLDDLCAPILTKVIGHLPPNTGEDELPTPIQEFYTFLNNILGESIRSGSHTPLVLPVLKALVQKNPTSLEDFAANLAKLFGRHVRESLPLPTQQMPAGQARPNVDAAVRIVKSMLEIWQIQMPISSEHRKSVLMIMHGLIEKTGDSSICKILLQMCRDWIFSRSDGFPTMKEKATLLAKMSLLEYKRFDDVFADFLNLILDIYKEPSLRRTDLTIKLESAFLVGCRSKDPLLRLKFVELFDDSLPRTLTSRLQWVLGSQTWENLSDHYWIPQALELLLGSITEEIVLAPAIGDVDMSASAGSARFGSRPVTTTQLLRPLKQLLHLDPDTAHQMWAITFGALWKTLSRKEQNDTHKSLIVLLTKDYHSRQMPLRRNVIQSLLEGVLRCQPPLALPPFVVKYLGKTFNAWHVALELLQESLKYTRDEESVNNAALDALAELYAELSEDDLFYGLWRRRAIYPETNIALSFEQCGLWQDAQLAYENAQLRARSGGAPFNEQEYCLWEDHWIRTSQKLQQWETLSELATQEGHHDLVLECSWRLLDWEKERETVERSLSAVAEVATPRRRVWEAFTCLIRGNPMGDRPEFTRLLEDAMQLSLRKWVALPPVVSTVHVPLLQHFQQLVELQEAAQIFHALATTTAQNLEKRSSDLKVVLQAWRERLPNQWDDIGVWSDLVAWRQHVFQTINKKFFPLIQQNNGAPGTASASTAGYRGYHEIAWIINRFAHVARKHELLEVCHSSLARIYTLPNIEISEAFLKLREQARCHYQVPAELPAGLEVINNTNLMYFTTPQKAEFFTLKGMFIARLGHSDEANAAFGQAVQMDLNMPKAWAEWGRYNDKVFKENPADMMIASNTVSCYLQAAGLYKSAKTRPLLVRILWFLSLDDQGGTIAKAFENFKGDIALWYWITLIPQLLKSLSHRAARQCRRLLIDIAHSFPQSLFFELRTSREEFQVLRRSSAAQAQALAAQANAQAQQEGGQGTANSNGVPTDGAGGHSATGQANANESSENHPSAADTAARTAQPWEFAEEIQNRLKTATPLLSPTMELLADNLAARFKPTSEEEIYRFIVALLTEALHHSTQSATLVGDDGSVPEISTQNVLRLASGLPQTSRVAFENDLVHAKPTLKEYIERLMSWRDRYEVFLGLRPAVQPLDLMSHFLAEFHHHTYEEVEVPGQYLEHKDNSTYFAKVARCAPTFEICRGSSYYYRRITFMGHDGSKHLFAIQSPIPRHSRREERVMQMFRIFNTALVRKKESRRRNLQFHLPHAIPVSLQVRLVENDSSYVTLQEVYEHQCRALRISREEPLLQISSKIRAMMARKPLDNVQLRNLKMELNEETAAKYIPRTVLSKYFAKTMCGPMDLWLMRKQFTLQTASISFMTYLLHTTARFPSRINISKSTGNIYVAEMMPNLVNGQTPVLASVDHVPFRLTPNMQELMTEHGIQGLLSMGINAIARCLTEPEYDLEQTLGIFVREEIISWYALPGRSMPSDLSFRTVVLQNVDQIVRRAEILACKAERNEKSENSKAPTMSATLAVDQLISQATNPQNLAGTTELFLPFL